MRIKKALLLFALLLPLVSAYSQITKSVSTEIQGVVPVVLNLSTDMTEIETVDLVNSSSAYLGKVVVYTNSPGLWKFVIKSSNAGKLKGLTNGNNDIYPYLLGFGTVERIDLTTDFEMTYNTLISKNIVEYPVTISYEKLSDLEDPVASDTYSDIVTIIVTVT